MKTRVGAAVWKSTATDHRMCELLLLPIIPSMYARLRMGRMTKTEFGAL